MVRKLVKSSNSIYVCIIYNNNNSSSARAYIDPTETYLATVATNERKKSARIRDHTSTADAMQNQQPETNAIFGYSTICVTLTILTNISNKNYYSVTNNKVNKQ